MMVGNKSFAGLSAKAKTGKNGSNVLPLEPDRYINLPISVYRRFIRILVYCLFIRWIPNS